MENKDRKLVFFDIDGTLVDGPTHQIPQSAVEAIRKLRENGHLAFINTGRTLVSIEPRIREIGFCLLYTSPSPRDGLLSRMPSSA